MRKQDGGVGGSPPQKATVGIVQTLNAHTKQTALADQRKIHFKSIVDEEPRST